MSLTYRIGDATRPRERPAAIVHIVNNKGLWGAGFTAALDYAYLGRPGNEYCNWAQGGLRNSAGPFGLDGVHIQILDEGLWLCHICAQNGVGRIGTGYGGGSWQIVEEILCRTIAPHFSTYVYDLG